MLLVAAIGSAAWHGHLTPAICHVGADSVPRSLKELTALAHARSRESACDGHAMECRFVIERVPGRNGTVVVVEHARIDFWARSCAWATDNETHYEYGDDGRFVPASGASS